MIKVHIHTDGACSGNPGPGGYGFIIWLLGREVEGSKGFEQTTNNIMELQGVIDALTQLPERQDYDITVYSDSQYVCNGFNKKWVQSWKRSGWKKSNGKPVKNVELWKELDSLVSKYGVKFHWVKGHADNEYNNRCDALAREAIESLR